MHAIVICTTGFRGVSVLIESIRQYAPGLPVYLSGRDEGLRTYAEKALDQLVWLDNMATNFGDAYNHAIERAFSHGDHQAVVVLNDDVVLNPGTIPKLVQDNAHLASKGIKVGLLGARSDYVLPAQNIRIPIEGDYLDRLRFASEEKIKEASVIAPICAAMSREAWEVARFPSTNWFSDDVICLDLAAAGFRHFVSRAYVHHVGSQTVGSDNSKAFEEAMQWLKANRPEIHRRLAATRTP